MQTPPANAVTIDGYTKAFLFLIRAPSAATALRAAAASILWYGLDQPWSFDTPFRMAIG
jgi:hypothetical protein